MSMLSEGEARQILGVSDSATFKEIGKARKTLVNLFHPDRAAKDYESQKRATESMSRINLAWSVIEARHAAGTLGKSDPYGSSSRNESSWGFPTRGPNNSECGICGSTPAQAFSIKGIVVLIISMGWPGYSGNLCKACATAFARDALRVSMVRGWWGVWYFITPFVMLRLAYTFWRISKMPEPLYRDYRVVTPYDLPVLSQPPPLKQLKPVASMVAGIFAIITLLVVSQNSPPTASSNTPFPVPDAICWTAPSATDQLTSVSCTDSTAVYRTISTVLDPTSCPPNTVGKLDKDSSGYYTCLGPNS